MILKINVKIQNVDELTNLIGDLQEFEPAFRERSGADGIIISIERGLSGREERE